jgi:hypothetical protein
MHIEIFLNTRSPDADVIRATAKEFGYYPLELRTNRFRLPVNEGQTILPGETFKSVKEYPHLTRQQQMVVRASDPFFVKIYQTWNVDVDAVRIG